MVYEERNVWVGLVVSVVAVATYLIVIVQSAGDGPLTGVDWLPPMLATIGVSIGVTIIVGAVWGMIAGASDPDSAGRSDVRDRDISRMGSRVEHAFLVLAGLGVIALCAIGAHVFWIAHAMFLGFAVSAVSGGIARVIAYRRGLV